MHISKRKLIDKISTYRIQIFISVSVIVLVLLLFIQFSWIKRARSLNEEQFNHRVGLALHESVDLFTKDLQSCQKMKEYMSKSNYDAHDSALLQSEVEHLDSIIKEQFKNYQIQSPYTIEVLSTADEQPKSKCFYFSLRKALSHDKAILNVYFKKREQNLMDSMGSMFICSIILILILCVLLGITIISLIRDKKILSRTTDLINNIAHEFKTPMATIALASKMLARDKVITKSDKVVHYSNIISTENNRLGVQIDQLLKLSNIERGELKLSFTSFHLHDLLEDCHDSLSMQIEEREGVLEFTKAASQELIFGDRDLLQNVFCNLLDNAIKYSPTTPQIELKSKNINGNLLVSISDKGIGMSKDVQKHIFDRYYRASTGDRHDVKGFGIGLSYSKMIINAHNGSIKVSSKKNIGSTFTVVLPVV